MELINVNEALCSKCGICTEVCPTRILALVEGVPQATNPNNCIGCGHCVAICPNGAIDNIKSPISKQTALENFPIIHSKTAQLFLRSRRSTRCFKNIAVAKDKLLELVDISHYAPTASNSQGISYIIISNKKILEKAAEVIINWMEQQLDNPSHWSFKLHVQAYKNEGKDTILRHVPHLILALASKDFKNGRNNAISSLTYAELYANTIGLGTCWAGLFEMCAFSNYLPLLELFNMPKDKVITGALMVGYPKYEYKRLAARNPLEATFID